ncbi:MAG: DNA topoisomerase (ATP-hydrolyzing) subunit A [Planctomycetota bacterium]|nr:DNA topoisomerase (ATP-hydrolyzing) subunit A [Planctomycetota bacterium]MDI6787707.1 DNA topoisomerase (ATP-hydrolyzing) subunit A [Planctomycetota bacterium]
MTYKNTSEDTASPQAKPSSVIEVGIENEMKDSYLTYAMSVIVSRALPDVRDGLKPSQRRILIAMNDLNLGPRAKYRKCAKICGDTSGNYHPHGEQVIYPTLVRLAQDFSCRYPLIDGQGNFGSIDGDPPAAMRYTEARLTEFASQMLEDLDRNTVDMVPNYDETREEPTVLPGLFPSLLCNGSSGIAVGMATSILPHNLGEVIDGIIKVIDDPEIEIKALIEIIKGPDFPTGGTICGAKGIHSAYTTGKGIITLRAKITTEEVKGGRTNIVVTEIPYNQEKNKIIERIAQLVKDDRIQGVADIRDESDRDGMRVVVELRRGEDPQITINQLYENTPLQNTFSIIMIALINNRPQLFDLKQLLLAYRDHRVEVIRRRTKFLLDKAEAELHILEGLYIAVDNIDEIIKLIKRSKTPEEAKEKLMSKYSLSTIQADAILQMQLRKLTGLEREKLAADIKQHVEKVADYKAILADSGLVLDIIKEDLYEMKEKYADKRKTDILKREVKEFILEELITQEDVVVVISHEGYVKRVPLTSYRKQQRGGRGVIAAETKEGDFIEHIFIASTHDYILFFTTSGKVHWVKVYDLPEMSRTARGRSIVNIIRFNQNEKITDAIPVKDFSAGFLVMATESGLIKKTPLEDYGNPMKGGIIALKLEDKDRLIGVRTSSGKDHIILGTKDGMAIRFSEENVRPMSRATYGVKGIKLRKSDIVNDMILVAKDSTLLSVCENGYGKRTKFAEYRLQRRGGVGIRNIKTSQRNGKLIALKEVKDDDELMMMSLKGMAVRIPVKGIRTSGRNTQGVRLIKLSTDDKLVSLARVCPEEIK